MRSIVLLLLCAASLPATTVGLPSGPGPAVCLIPADPLVANNGSIGATVSLVGPAPAGGVTVTLGSNDPGIATIQPATLFVPAGTTTSAPGAVTISGVSNGTTTLTASVPGSPAGTAAITTTDQVISLGFGLAVIPGQTAGLPVSLSVPAPSGGVTLSFTSSDPAVATVQSSIFIPGGQQIPAANPMVTGVALGTASISASASAFAPDTRDVTVASNVLTLEPDPVVVAESFTATFDVRLAVSAPPGGQLVTLATDHPAIASVPSTVMVPVGENTVAVTITGVQVGPTTLRANATGIPEGTADVDVVPPAIGIPDDVIGGDLMAPRQITLSAPAPAGNLAVTLTSADPGRLLLSDDPTDPGAGSVTITIGAGQVFSSSYWVHALDDAGQVTVLATAPQFQSDTATYTLTPSGFRIWSPSAISISTGVAPVSVSLRSQRLDNALVPVESQRLRGGLTVPLAIASSDPTVGAMVNSPVFLVGGDLNVVAEFEPLGAGSAVVALATPPGFQTPTLATSITASVFAQGLSLSAATIGDDLEISRQVFSSAPAPAGNLAVTLTSADPTRLLLSSDATVGGSASVTVTIPAGASFSPAVWFQALDDNGTVDVTATAPAFGPGLATFTLAPSGFRIWSPSVVNASTGTSPTSIQLRSTVLDPGTLSPSFSQRVRGGLAVNVPFTSSDPSVGTVTLAPVPFFGGDLSNVSGFLPLAAGTTQLTIGAPAGFDTPSLGAQIAANVFDQSITVQGTTVGRDLQVPRQAFLSAPAPAGNLALTLTSLDPSRVLLAADPTTAGSASITITVNAGSTVSPQFWVHGTDDQGTAIVRVSAPAFADGFATFTLAPSGVVIWSPATINTNTFASPVTLSLRTAALNAGSLALLSSQRLRGGISRSLTVNSSDPNVAAIIGSPVTFVGGDLLRTAGFDPLTAGMTTVSLAQPAGFVPSSNANQVPATVTAPAITFADVAVGEDLQQARTAYLASFPPNPVDVTFTVNDPSLATITLDPTVAGTGSLTVSGVAGTTVGTIHVQGRVQGSTTILVQAAGYADRIANVDIHPSGFIVWSPASITTTLLSSPSTIQVRPVRLDPVTLNYTTFQRLRGGLSVAVPVMSSSPAVGTLTLSPIPFVPDALSNTTSFQPAGPGVTTLTVVAPPGFDTPSNASQITATVDAPDININPLRVGENLQATLFVGLQAAPPAPTTFSARVQDPAVARLATSLTGAGAQAVTFATGTSSFGSLYVQGMAQGTTEVFIQGPGYDLGTATITVDPSGFIFWTPITITTSTFSTPSSVQVRPARLDPVTLNYTQSQRIRGGFAAYRVLLDSSNPAAGAFADRAIGFQSGDLVQNSPLVPSAAGATTLTLTQPPGFTLPSNRQQIPTTVTAPGINVSNVTVGADLQRNVSLSLQAAPPTPTSFTVTVGNPALARISTSTTTLGTGSVVVTTAGFSLPSLSVHGLQTGSTTLTVTAPGYARRTVTVAVHPSGFRVWSPASVTTTLSAAPVTVTLRPTVLDPVTLNVTTSQRVRAGLSVSVPVSVANPGVATVPATVTFGAGDLVQTLGLTPVAVGATTFDVGMAPGFDMPSNGIQIPVTVDP